MKHRIPRDEVSMLGFAVLFTAATIVAFAGYGVWHVASMMHHIVAMR